MLKDVSILGGARLVPLVLAFVQSIVVARVLGPEAFGQVAVIAAFPAVVFGILNVRTAETTTRFLAGFDEQHMATRASSLCKLAYGIDLIVAMVAFGIVWTSAAWIGPALLTDRSLTPLMIVYGISFLPNALVPTSGSILAVTGRFLVTGTLEVIGASVRSGLVMTLVLSGWGIAGVVYGVVIGNAVTGLLNVILAHRVSRQRWGQSWLRGGWRQLAGHRRELARFFVLSDITGLFGVAIKNADVLLLARYVPAADVGYYNLGKSVTNQLLSLIAALRTVAFPPIMRLWTTGAWEPLWRHIRTNTWRFGLPGLAGVVVLMLLMPRLVALVYGPAYAPAVAIIQLLLLQVVLVLLTLWLDMVFLAWGDMHILAVTRGLGAIVTIMTILLLAPGLGIVAGAVALLLQQGLSAVLTASWMWARRRRRKAEAARRRLTVADSHDVLY